VLNFIAFFICPINKLECKFIFTLIIHKSQKRLNSILIIRTFASEKDNSMSAQLLEWIGYTASVIIAISMTMSSIVKFRWINFSGALLFSIYGFLIGAIPVGVLNGLIVITDAYYLLQIYSKKDIFEVLQVRAENKYFLKFIDFHQNDIKKFFPQFKFNPSEKTVCFLVLRNMVVAGVFIAHRTDEKTLEVELDYVLPEYRDFKNGRYVYYWLSKEFIDTGFTKVWAQACNNSHAKYLEKLGFIYSEQTGKYLKLIES